MRNGQRRVLDYRYRLSDFGQVPACSASIPRLLHHQTRGQANVSSSFTMSPDAA